MAQAAVSGKQRKRAGPMKPMNWGTVALFPCLSLRPRPFKASVKLSVESAISSSWNFDQRGDKQKKELIREIGFRPRLSHRGAEKIGTRIAARNFFRHSLDAHYLCIS